ncbi:MAG: 50S ribosomal protein L17 [Candidatus Portnoybacteria bacterium CG_4_8_14_3_um_filter_44_15]|uniref:50S ribosomal protein L17 n=3 Tax=Candidatus Portnoyibacteriota TaxID=1817913 RepID=A0A2M7YM94_9BACT|nr:MAG: 50S ribosomal protein L17 [Parcubacteria group bacterium CG1_02_44_65]PIW74678.1 MAG: 50S ribosomal protein L17 [Candidatus Portnoybacteria bacterium CG_4_8_14_3_um_filter_44_15]PIZ69691.1 MAG: 50S ribosomal protein L17 [Candidatus Portnoybacteria bacterium CG_4_10_14_0_2_um_filter_43_36]PJA64087.1 MAG: 50S ribosomal protein L17 [Candidatus Portnoybacteria bacterium CG_4_9_14_3_um_filter_43_11]
MRKMKKGRKFGRKRDQRKAFLKILAANLIFKERVRTTQARAKEIRPIVERLITKGKKVYSGEEGKKNLAAVRALSAYLPEKAVKKLIDKIVPRYHDRNGGYIRIVKLSEVRKDGAEMAIIELVK